MRCDTGRLIEESCVFVDVVCIDAVIHSEETRWELCRALHLSQLPASRLRLRIGKLDMSRLDVPRTVVLLKELELEVMP